MNARMRPADEGAAVSERIWICKIGGPVDSLPDGADFPMRKAVERAFREITGVEAEFNFSGWGGELTEPERAVVEDRLPSQEYEDAWHARQDGLLDTSSSSSPATPWPNSALFAGDANEKERPVSETRENAAQQLMDAMERVLHSGHRAWEPHQNDPEWDELAASLTAVYMAWRFAAHMGLLPHGPKSRP